LNKKTKRGKLGKDLDVLLGTVTSSAAVQGSRKHSVGVSGDSLDISNTGLQFLPLEKLRPGKYQPRRDFDSNSLEELAESIRSQGVLQPIVARAISDTQWEIIAGERRWRASQLAGIDKIPALIRDVSDEATIAMALIENIQRENLNAIEEAEALRRLQTEFALSQQQVAERVGKSRSVIANLLRLLVLEPVVRTMMEAGDLNTGHGKVLLALEGADQVKAAKKVVKGGLSVRQTESLVKSVRVSEVKPEEKGSATNPDVLRLERELSGRLGSSVKITQGKGQQGKLVISYSSLDQLDGILERIH
jgi:ParB family chromosome partitioning protein